MATTNRDRIAKCMDLLQQGLAPFVERELKSAFRDDAHASVQRILGDDRLYARKTVAQLDAAGLLKVLWDAWNDVFGRTLGRSERSLVQELRDWRNKWAHQDPFSSDDTDRALDSAARLLSAVSAPQADDVQKIKQELRRLVADEQVRDVKRKAGGSLIEASLGMLKPWREVVTPHQDVASGRYQQAEFAADLWQVHIGEGSDEYKKPEEFFRRTFLTESLKRLLVGAAQRLSGSGGDPVVQLQTNFGGGKTHSMLALYHLFSGAQASKLAGIDDVIAQAGVKNVPVAKRVVLVGNKISPGNPVKKPDGVVVRTLWGELAYQLGGKTAYARVAADDEKATSPGDALRELLTEYGPALILIDEWVAYARQLHDEGDLPAGSFETQFSFAQALTESAKLAKNCLLVISLPASDTSGSPQTQTDDVEVGGVRGRSALDRLRNVVGRLESSWRPASAEEGFEIVRRRLFENLASQEHFKQRDVTARAFGDMYRAQASMFPPAAKDAEYERRIQAAYPIHPEIFDRLYTDWSTLVKFQRTRGVLRLMAAVIHCLWEKGDRNPLILPSTVPIDDPRVQFELTRYLSDNWTPIIEKDVDGPQSLPVKLDGELTHLGKLHATRRVARAIYLGSAPTGDSPHRGVEDRHVALGCVMPGESPNVYGDALRRLASAATFLYQDGNRYWYSTQATVTKLAEDRADDLRRNPDPVIHELEERLKADLQRRGDFLRVHVAPKSGADVPDDMDTRLVVLSSDYLYSKDAGNPAEVAAKGILESRGSAPRLFRNTLVFMAGDKARMQDLDEALRKYLAWDSILKDKEALNLTPFQVRSADAQLKGANSAVISRLPETYQWLLVPVQQDPQSPVEWQVLKLAAGTDGLASRASKKLRNDELLITGLAGTRLRMELDKIPLWRGDHVSLRVLLEDFAKYVYLPRVSESDVLRKAVTDGVALLTWEQDTFAYADSIDEAAGRYRGLRGGQRVDVPSDSAFVVRPNVARKQLASEAVPVATPSGQPTTSVSGPPAPGQPVPASRPKQPTRYHGTVVLDSLRTGRDAGEIADEVISHLAGLVGAKVTVTLEIEAIVPSGVPENVVRTVTENGRTLKFESQGFEDE